MNRMFRAIFGIAALIATVQSAPAQQFTLKISSPTVNDALQEWGRLFAEGVKARAGDKIKVEFYPASQLGQIPATVEGLAMGTIEVVGPASGFFIGLEPRFQVFDAPGLFNDMTHAQRVFADRDAGQAGQAGYVDQDVRRRQAQVERGKQALAAGEQLGAVAVLREQREHLAQRCRPGVGECGGFHVAFSSGISGDLLALLPAA